jgi:tetratricopeptide (TPR) repeat protein
MEDRIAADDFEGAAALISENIELRKRRGALLETWGLGSETSKAVQIDLAQQWVFAGWNYSKIFRSPQAIAAFREAATLAHSLVNDPLVGSSAREVAVMARGGLVVTLYQSGDEVGALKIEPDLLDRARHGIDADAGDHETVSKDTPTTAVNDNAAVAEAVPLPEGPMKRLENGAESCPPTVENLWPKGQSLASGELYHSLDDYRRAGDLAGMESTLKALVEQARAKSDEPSPTGFLRNASLFPMLRAAIVQFDPDAQVDRLASRLRDLGEFYADHGRTAEARAAFIESRKLYTNELAATQTAPTANRAERDNKAIGDLEQLTALDGRLGRPADVRAGYLEILAILRAGMVRRPADWNLAIRSGDTRRSLARFLYDGGQHTEALRETRANLAEAHGFVARFPDNPMIAFAMVDGQFALASQLDRTAGLAVAEKEYIETLRMCREAQQRYPNYLAGRDDCGMTRDLIETVFPERAAAMFAAALEARQ